MVFFIICMFLITCGNSFHRRNYISRTFSLFNTCVGMKNISSSMFCENFPPTPPWPAHSRTVTISQSKSHFRHDSDNTMFCRYVFLVGYNTAAPCCSARRCIGKCAVHIFRYKSIQRRSSSSVPSRASRQPSSVYDTIYRLKRRKYFFRDESARIQE